MNNKLKIVGLVDYIIVSLTQSKDIKYFNISP
jgi:hypothetical protein